MPNDPAPRRPLILAAVMAATFMIAVEATIVSTAMPQIAGQLGDLHLYSWVFSAFLLAQTATTLVFGKLADLFGRKPVLLVGISIFLVGSVLCGFAWSMPSLIVFRLLQGAGAGAIQPVSLTVVGDLYPARERGKVQGYLASVWGISSVLGPLVGGLIVQHVSWSWVFWINVPIGIAACIGFVLYLNEAVSRRSRSVDVIGAGLFTVAVAGLMLALTELGTADHGTALVAGLVGIVGLGLFVWQERRAKDPMLAFGLWARRPIATANAATVLSGMTIIGLTTFLPMYVQGVLGRTAMTAGFALTMMVLGWPIGATVAARQFGRVGLRATLLFGAVLMPLGGVAFVLLGPGSSPVMAGMGSLVIGLGMGFLSTSAILIIQDTVDWAERGAATASNLFSRNIGSTLGATVLGSVLNISLARDGGGAGVGFDQVRQLLDGAQTGAGGVSIEVVRGALGHSLHLTFWAVFVIACLTLVTALLVPTIRLRADVREAAAE